MANGWRCRKCASHAVRKCPWPEPAGWISDPDDPSFERALTTAAATYEPHAWPFLDADLDLTVARSLASWAS